MSPWTDMLLLWRQGACAGRMRKERTVRPMGLLHRYRSSIAPYGALGTSARRFHHAYLRYMDEMYAWYTYISTVLPQERSSVGATDGLKQAFPQCQLYALLSVTVCAPVPEKSILPRTGPSAPFVDCRVHSVSITCSCSSHGSSPHTFNARCAYDQNRRTTSSASSKTQIK